MIIAVDFDDTLSLGSLEFMESNIPLIKKIIEVRELGHKIILWTCRGEEWLDEAIEFCKSHGLEFDAINENVKGYDWWN